MESKKDINALRSRWSEADTDLINGLLAAGRLNENRLASIEVSGRQFLDLRGFTLNRPIHHQVYSCIDLSYAVADVMGQLVEVTLRECRFVGADLSHTNIGRLMDSCDFASARLKILRGQFVNCRFTGADLTKVRGSQVTFIRCDFTDANFRKACLYNSTFEECIWRGNRFRSGSLAGSRFIRTRPDPTALGNTIMEDAVFID